MHPVIVVTELRKLPPEERWGKLVLPLEQKLNASGLGSVLEFETLRRQTAEQGVCTAEEVAVELAHMGYGRELLDRVIRAAGIPPGKPVMPSRWLAYHCEEYFAAGWAERGHFHEPSQTPVVFPISGVFEDADHQFLVIGTSGGDGVDFGYRDGHTGLWAWPIDGEFWFMAPTLAELVEDWCSGKLSI